MFDIRATKVLPIFLLMFKKKLTYIFPPGWHLCEVLKFLGVLDCPVGGPNSGLITVKVLDKNKCWKILTKQKNT